MEPSKQNRISSLNCSGKKQSSHNLTPTVGAEKAKIELAGSWAIKTHTIYFNGNKMLL